MSKPTQNSPNPFKLPCAEAKSISDHKIQDTDKSYENRLFLRAVCKSGFKFRVTTFQPLRGIAHNYRKRYNHNDCIVELYKGTQLIKSGDTYESLGLKIGDELEVRVGGWKADVISFEEIGQSSRSCL